MRILEQVPCSPGVHSTVIPVQVSAEQLMNIPVRVLRGTRNGPVLLVTAGEHGCELNGVAAIDRLVRELSPDALSGTLIAVPAINPWNVKSVPDANPGGSYAAEWDTYRKWPGDDNGDPAERITAALSESVVANADVVINMHSWSWHSTSCVFTCRSNQHAVSLAKTFGFPFVALSFAGGIGTADRADAPLDPKHNNLTHYAMANGKPAMLVELRTQFWIDPESVRRAMQGTRNVMISLGMLDGEIVTPRMQYECYEDVIVEAPSAGLFIPVIDVEELVEEDDMLGYVLDLETGERQEIFSPCSGATWLMNRFGSGPSYLDRAHAYATKGDMLALIKRIRPITIKESL